MEKAKLQMVEASFAVVFLGVWLLAAPATFGYAQSWIGYGNWIIGVLLMVFGALSVPPHRHWAAAATCALGVILQLMPLFLWAKEPQAYLNDTMVGLLAFILGLMHPQMTGLPRKGGLHNPPGWSFNPSSWSLRTPTVALAVLCWFFSRYMAAYQLGYIDVIRDPLFGQGTEFVITSKISHMFPVSDAGLGAFVYTLEALMGWQGDTKRWHTMPWMVLIFGFLVVPAGLVSILLIIAQPVFVGAWCGWCLATAACMLVMIVFTTAEVIATLQFLRHIKQRGQPFWTTVWFGGVIGEEEAKKRPRVRHSKRLAFGITLPWNLVITALLGAWLMLDPYVLGTLKPAADLAYIIGPLLIVFSVIAFAEAARAIRYVNRGLGALLLILPWFFPGASSFSLLLYVIVGLATLGLSIPRGSVCETYGSWNKFVR